ncbi:transcriptional repressor NrdR [Syntrophus gentianae]|uniref:Transcriptional repressor NrdR n=1 Tax=Syntrophus gentianae TaxID=43775 RepID=A0A1H7ZUJ3_9BACT|nr:transcriptional regulator NrdR [Syntrophus gentianae]SEM62120.1 transcriptional repressor NrdR [Syntrophus gentianae]
MKCPFCGDAESKVMDSRVSRDGNAIRRRRECLACGRRFTTYEYIEEIMPTVVKKDGRREPFDRNKIRNGVRKACQKRPISTETMESLVANVERFCQEYSGEEMSSSRIGEKVMQLLKDLDGVAYVRFASVYRQFRDVKDFLEELKEFQDEKKEDEP